MSFSLKGWLHRLRSLRASHRKPYDTIEIVSFRPRNESINFGDELSPVIIDLMLASKGYTRFDAIKRPTKLLCIGSVMHLASDDSVIWGTGVNGKTPDSYHHFSRLDVRAVRGPHTRKFLQDRGIACPEIYGDPGLLLPQVTNGRFDGIARTRPVVFVPNLNDLTLPVVQGLDIPVVSPLQSWHAAVAEILSAELVLASSLHGLVVADAYGIPARYVRLSERESMFKYRDYYEGTGRPNVDVVNSVAEALGLGGAPAPVFDKDALMASFPFDLWVQSGKGAA